MKPTMHWIRRVLHVCLPRDVAEDWIGDLEEVRERRLREGRPVRLWYMGQALSLGMRGGGEMVKEMLREWFGAPARGPFTRGLGFDARAAVRAVLRRPATTLAAVTALGVGIGLTTTTFSIVWGSLLRGLPVERPDELVHFERARIGEDGSLAVTYHDYLDWRARQTGFEDLGAYVETVVTLTGEVGWPERFVGLEANTATFEQLGVSPAQGRLFDPAEQLPGGAPVALISDRLWRSRFGEDPGLLGSTVDMNGVPTTVVGIMPAGFSFPFDEDLWLPLQLDPGDPGVERGGGRLDVIARLRPGITLEVARAEFDAIGAGLEADHPDTNAQIRPELKSFNTEFIGEEFPRIVYGLLVGAALVLLVACANVASLLLVQATGRARELAVRSALGASRARVVRQLVLECLMLAGAASVLGVLIARGGVGWFRSVAFQVGTLQLPHGSVAPFWWDFRVDAGPLAFTLLVAFGVTLIVGLAPAMLARRADVTATLRGAGSNSAPPMVRRWFGPLIVAETALTGAVLVAAGLMVKSALNMSDMDPGFETESIVTARIGLPSSAASGGRAYTNTAERLLFWEQLGDALRVQPGARSATLTTDLPMVSAWGTTAAVEGSDGEGAWQQIRRATVDPSFFEVFGVEAIEGRLFDRTDGPGTERVALVNESFQARHFPDASPLFQRIRIGGEDATDPWMTIVGVVPDLMIDGERNRIPEGVYLPLAQAETPDPRARFSPWGLRYPNVAVHTNAGLLEAGDLIRETAATLDATLPVYGLRTMDEVVGSRLRRYRLFGTFYLVFGAAALFLAVLGTYGVTAFSVASRTSEIGIRMALGAGSARIRRLVLSQGLRTVGIGLVLGLAGALWLTGGLARVVFHVDPRDPTVFLFGLGVLGAAAVVACLLPARRACRVEVTRAVRGE